MSQLLQIDREEILKKAELESELSDLKQHADKMIRGFENFNSFSSNRAIWELIQNACDLSINCEVIIDYSGDNFSFSHNGKLFTTNALNSLIKQVSGKYGEDSDIPEVGKYGTGFLTTHTFGRKFLLNSVLEVENAFFQIKDFLIDRSPKEWKELSANVKTQKDNVYKLILDGEQQINPLQKTTFTFLSESVQEKQYVNDSKEGLDEYIPIVLAINNRLKKVIVKDKNEIFTDYELLNKEKVINEKDINLYKTEISVNGDLKVLYSIVDEEEQIEIILPINKNHELFQFSNRTSRLFLYYPLIGSEDFGINFIINCNKFLPTEPRDGIHLSSNKEQVKEQEVENRRIIEKSSAIIFQFLKSNVLEVSNPMLYGQVNFKRTSENLLLNNYFENLQSIWQDEISELAIVHTAEGYLTPNQVYFLDAELLNKDVPFDEVYELLSIFYKNIPSKETIIIWSSFMSTWGEGKIDFLGNSDITNHISSKELKDFNKKSLLKYYQYLVDTEKINFFSEYTLIPSIYGKFQFLTSLFKPKNINEKLIKIGNGLIPEIIGKLVHEEFYFNFSYPNFNRRDFSNSVKTQLDYLYDEGLYYIPDNLEEEEEENYTDSLSYCESVDITFFKSLIDYCKLTNNLNSQSKPLQLIKILCNYYSFDDNLIQISNVEPTEENLELRSARKILCKMFFNIIELHNESWVEKNLPLLLNIANCNEDSLKELYLSSNIYPNQFNQLKSINDLKRDIDISEKIKNLYDKVSGADIKETLIYKEFNEFVPEDRYLTNKYLCNQIEEIFFNSDIKDINEHPFKDDILNIISNLNTPAYKGLFPRLDLEKAKLMLEVVTNEETKDDIFSIVTLEKSQLKKVGLLIQNENFETLLEIALNTLEDVNQKKANFQFKHQIGTHIEDILKLHLEGIFAPEDIEVDILSEQDGQDIIIKIKNEAKYYIEVKSRWDKRTSIRMSKNQTIRSNEQKLNYALCSVDMTDYLEVDRFNISDINKIIPCIKYVTDIGSEVEHLIDVLKQTNQHDTVHLDGDYRTLIPQMIIEEKGINLISFEKYLIEFLKK